MSDFPADVEGQVERLRDPNFAGAMQHLRDWSELDRLHDEAAARLTALARQVEEMRAALEPFARVADVGKRGGEFVIAKAIYSDMGGRAGISAPRGSHWHWDDFERARAAAPNTDTPAVAL